MEEIDVLGTEYAHLVGFGISKTVNHHDIWRDGLVDRVVSDPIRLDDAEYIGAFMAAMNDIGYSVMLVSVSSWVEADGYDSIMISPLTSYFARRYLVPQLRPGRYWGAHTLRTSGLLQRLGLLSQDIGGHSLTISEQMDVDTPGYIGLITGESRYGRASQRLARRLAAAAGDGAIEDDIPF